MVFLRSPGGGATSVKSERIRIDHNRSERRLFDMKMELLQLSCRNFKVAESLEYEFSHNGTVITGATGTGKTSICDAFLWVLFGKDSTGRKEFDLRPLDKKNKLIKGLTLSVTVVIDIDGTIRTLRKEHKEKVVKRQITGYETLCWIDDVPKKVGAYNEAIAEMLPEETFKMLTDLTYFNSKLHWSERREVLLDFAGEIGTPDGFDRLLDKLNGRTMDEYKKVLADQKKRHESERGEINPRLDELNRADDLESVDSSELERERATVTSRIADHRNDREAIVEDEQCRQKKINRRNELDGHRIVREAELKNNTDGISHLLDEKTKIATGVADLAQVVADAKNVLAVKKSEVASAQSELATYTAAVSRICDEYNKVFSVSADSTCYACGQPLPSDKIAENETQRNANLTDINKRGMEAKQAVNGCKEAIAALEVEASEYQERLEKAQIELREGEEYKAARIKRIDEAIESRDTISPETDKIWIGITDEIKATNADIGEPVSQQIEQIDGRIAAGEMYLAKLNKSLAQLDRAKQDRARIVELVAREKELAQLIADIDQQIDDIGQYRMAESQIIEAAVNDMFKHVEFKLFNELLNGGIEETCVATLAGVPYGGMSGGQKIIVGIDIVNVISAHYGVSVPLFIDNAESLTLAIEASCQTIELYAKKGVNPLVVDQKKGKPLNV